MDDTVICQLAPDEGEIDTEPVTNTGPSHIFDRGVHGWYQAVELTGNFLDDCHIGGSIRWDSSNYKIVRIAPRIQPVYGGAVVLVEYMTNAKSASIPPVKKSASRAEAYRDAITKWLVDRDAVMVEDVWREVIQDEAAMDPASASTIARYLRDAGFKRYRTRCGGRRGTFICTYRRLSE